MHDPMTVAFEIRYPWYKYRPGEKSWSPEGYRDTFITIWHVDPELHGDDDSCGFGYPRVTGKYAEKTKVAIKDELQFHKLFEATLEEKYLPKHDVLTMLYSVYTNLHWFMFRNRLQYKDLARILYLGCSQNDNLRYYCDLQDRDNTPLNEDEIKRFYWLVARQILHAHRKWYQHPRWHIHHWQVQIHPWQKFKRWVFSRCARCGGRFSWGESPTSTSWNSKKPSHFWKSEDNVYHSKCYHTRPKNEE